MPTPMNTKADAKNIVTMEYDEAKIAMSAKPTATLAKPRGMRGHPPRLSIIRPLTRVDTALHSTGMSMTTPAMNAVMPHAPSR